VKLALTAAILAALEASAVAAPTPEELYAEGQVAYDKADYATAIADWQASYKASGANGLLFNLAQAYRLRGDCKQALFTYKRFVAIDPSVDQRALADDFIRELEPTCGAVVAAPATDRPVDAPGRTMKLAGIATGGAGVVLFVTGVALGHHASTLGNDVTAACTVSCDWSIEKSKDAAGHRDSALGWTFGTVGALALLGGAALYYFGDRASEISVTPVATRSHDSGAVLSWSHAW
jgi:tetratricopeptide (TPR) repeat protein